MSPNFEPLVHTPLERLVSQELDDEKEKIPQKSNNRESRQIASHDRIVLLHKVGNEALRKTKLAIDPKN